MIDSRAKNALRRKRMLRVLLLVAGILIPQMVMLWPSLSGKDVMLPVDIVAFHMPGLYSKDGDAQARAEMGAPRWPNSGDAVTQYEAFRRYAVSEVWAGRLPAWNPHNYSGEPFIGNGQSAVFSPYRAIEFLLMDPVVVAWSQLAKALMAGLGMFMFLRRGLRSSWRAGVVGAWLYPLSGFLTVWAGSPMAAGATWMGWVLWATESSIRRAGLRGPLMLGLFTAFVGFSGHPQIIGHTLVISGVYAGWRLAVGFRRRRDWRVVWRGAGACLAGWALGLCLAAPQLLPLVDYTLASMRLEVRSSGVVERSAQGLWALMQAAQPWICGEESQNSAYLLRMNRQESGAAGYAGLLALFVLAPLAWRAGRTRAQAAFWTCVGVLGMAQVAGLPLLGQLVMLPPLGMLSSNRLTCLTAFAGVVLAALGAQAATRRGARGALDRRWLFWLAVPFVIGLFLAVGLGDISQRVAAAAERRAGGSDSPTFYAVSQLLKGSLEKEYFLALGLLVVACLLFKLLAWRGASVRRRRLTVGVVVVLSVVEMMVMVFPAIPQVDRRWYPGDPEVIQALKRLPAGRVLAVDTFPSNINLWWGVDFVLGYDALDPVEMTRLILSAAHDADNPNRRSYSTLMGFRPSNNVGVMRALGVRYVLFPSSLGQDVDPVLRAENFFVYELPGAVPRAYVPARVVRAPSGDQILKWMNDPAYDPGALALVSGPDSPVFEGASGSVVVKEEIPGRVVLSVDMRTPGMVVLADRYDSDWQAVYQGRPVETVKVNYAQRGVALAPGTGVLEFRYRPWGLRWGLGIMGIAAAGVLAAALWSIRKPLQKR